MWPGSTMYKTIYSLCWILRTAKLRLGLNDEMVLVHRAHDFTRTLRLFCIWRKGKGVEVNRYHWVGSRAHNWMHFQFHCNVILHYESQPSIILGFVFWCIKAKNVTILIKHLSKYLRIFDFVVNASKIGPYFSSFPADCHFQQLQSVNLFSMPTPCHAICNPLFLCVWNELQTSIKWLEKIRFQIYCCTMHSAIRAMIFFFYSSHFTN